MQDKDYNTAFAVSTALIRARANKGGSNEVYVMFAGRKGARERTVEEKSIKKLRETFARYQGHDGYDTAFIIRKRDSKPMRIFNGAVANKWFSLTKGKKS